MSRRIPHFLQRLGLGLEADARSIRRAYAVELKKIDQETDLPGFQSLREDYEQALQWAKQRPQAAVPVDTPVPAEPPGPAIMPPGLENHPQDPVPPQRPAAVAVPMFANPVHQPQPPSLPPQRPATVAGPKFAVPVHAPLPPASMPAPSPVANPQALADSVFARFQTNLDRLVNLGMLKDPSLVEAELCMRLDDDELVNISARTVFEGRIVGLLCSGWSAEGGVLLGAAASVFDWDNDHRRLLQFGQAGVFLERAVAEATMFGKQGTAELVKQRNLILRLRQPKRPPAIQIRRDIVHLERMIARFPSYLSLMVSRESVEEWRAAVQSSAPLQAAATADTLPEPVLRGHSNKRRFDGAWIFFALLIAVYAAIGWSDRSDPAYYARPPGPERESKEPVYAPGADPLAPDYRPVQLQREPSYAPGADPSAPDYRPHTLASPEQRAAQSAAITDAISRDIDYRPAAGAPKGRRLVVFEVLAGPNGKIYGMNRLQRSVDPQFDEAVQAAIMRSPALPAGFGTRVRMQFGVDVFSPAPRLRGTGGAIGARPPLEKLTPAERQEVRDALDGAAPDLLAPKPLEKAPDRD